MFNMVLDMHWTGKVESVAFSIGNKDIAWYGIIITCAMLIGLIVGIFRAKRIGLKSEDVIELFLYVIPLSIIGARIGYVMVRPEYFPSPFTWNDFVNAIAIWDGGLTIITGVPFGILGAYIWSKVRRVNLIDVMDVILPIALLSQGLGRWGNFMNQEIYGAPITDPKLQWFPLAVYIARKGGFYQATFFYEMALDILFFVIIIIIARRLKVRGGGTLMYMFAYPFIRFILEFLRDDGDLYAKFNYTQWGCFAVAVISLVWLIILIVRQVKKGNRVWYAKGIPAELYPDCKVYEKPSKKSVAKAEDADAPSANADNAKCAAPEAKSSEASSETVTAKAKTSKKSGASETEAHKQETHKPGTAPYFTKTKTIDNGKGKK